MIWIREEEDEGVVLFSFLLSRQQLLPDITNDPCTYSQQQSIRIVRYSSSVSVVIETPSAFSAGLLEPIVSQKFGGSLCVLRICVFFFFSYFYLKWR